MPKASQSHLEYADFPRFDTLVPTDGYQWWYVDALSDDREYALTLIAFVGSVFSPWYFRSRRAGSGDPLDHCTLNAVLYGRREKRWAFTERGRAAVERSAECLTIGPSEVRWDGDALTVALDEVTVPLPARLRGTIRLYPEILTGESFALDTAGLHHWRPVAPRARVEVDLDKPDLRWSGSGYFDSNRGSHSLEEAFLGWHWSRADLGDAAAILYDIERSDGSSYGLAVRYDRSGIAQHFEPPDRAGLRRSGWRVPRLTRSDEPAQARVVRTLEDTPFYVRSVIRTGLFGQATTAMHESLSLTRFASPWVQCLLPFRAPRRARS